MTRLIGLALVVLLGSGCAMFREGNGATTPNPKDWPCGYMDADFCPGGVVGHRTCCRYHGRCLDDGACEFHTPSDPADPTMLRRVTRGPRVHE